MEQRASPFGEQLRQFRVRAGLSQVALAERANLSPAAVATLERGVRSTPYPRTVDALAQALGLSAQERAALAATAGRPRRLPQAMALRPDQSRVRAEPLPFWLTSFVGREAEVEAVRVLLDPARSAVRLLTLLGPGGVGKTRLAVAVAADLVDAYPDGMVFVDLAPVRDQRLVPATIARALDLRESGGRSAREVLLESLRERQVLVVLDNFEQLLGARFLLAELLQRCPRVALLVTSRAALRVQGEYRFPVAPLATPRVLPGGNAAQGIGASPAVQLFVARAQAMAADFVLTDGNTATVADICCRLDGIPLAIELAAARVPLLPPAALLRRLERRLSVLTGGAADLPERQQTLRATLTWSYELLEPASQVLFRRLAAFTGGWTMEAAEAVCADAVLPVDAVLDRLQELVDSSLVRGADEAGREKIADASDEPRLEMLDTVRELALELLEASGEAEVVRARHAAYLVQVAERLVTALRTSGHTDNVVRLGRERDNLRAALDWLSSRADLQPALGLAAATAWLWAAEGQVAEGRDQLDRLLTAAPEPTPARAAALLSAAMLAWGQGDYESQERLARESLVITRARGQPGATAEALSTLGAAAFQRGEYSTARVLLAESLDLFRGLGQQLGIGWTLMRLASVARDQGQFAEAEHLYQEALGLRRAAEDRSGVAHILSNLSWLAHYTGAHTRAWALQEESLAIRRASGDRREIAMSLVVLARIALAQGARATAWAPLCEGLNLCRAVGDRWEIVLALEVLAGLLAADQPARALRLAGATSVLRAAIGRPVPPPEQPLLEAWLEPAWRALGDAAAAAWAEGANLTADAALAAALADALEACAEVG